MRWQTPRCRARDARRPRQSPRPSRARPPRRRGGGAISPRALRRGEGAGPPSPPARGAAAAGRPAAEPAAAREAPAPPADPGTAHPRDEHAGARTSQEVLFTIPAARARPELQRAERARLGGTGRDERGAAPRAAPPVPPARQEREGEKRPEQRERQEANATRRVARRRGRHGGLAGARGRGADQALERVHGGAEPVRVAPGAKRGGDVVADDRPRVRVRDLRLEPVADLDPYRALAQRHDHEHAVVLAPTADLPRLFQSSRKIVDGGAAEVLEDRDGDLVAGCLVVRREAPVERGL